MTKDKLESVMRESSVMSGLLDAGISVPGVRSLVREFGGGRVYVPSLIEPDHYLFTLLGGRDAGRLSAYAGGDAFYVPKGQVIDRTLLAEEVLAFWDDGARTIREVRKRFNLSERYIRKIISDAGKHVERRVPEPKPAKAVIGPSKEQMEFKWK